MYNMISGRLGSGSRRRFLGDVGWVALGALALPRQGFARGLPHADAPTKGTLKALGAAHGLLTGCVVDGAALPRDAAYASLVLEESSLIALGSELDWRTLRPAEDRYEFDRADEMLSFAEKHRVKLRGRTLCGQRDVPSWVQSRRDSHFLEDHVERVTGRYTGRVHSWDVVSEAIEVRDGRPDGLRRSRWLAAAGADYVERAFRAARGADPQALLTYNESGLEPETPEAESKRTATLLLLRRLKARNVPVDALGVESHLISESGEGLLRFLRAAAELDLQIFLTEMDLSARAAKSEAGLYGRYLDLVLKEPAITVLLMNSITERYTPTTGVSGGHLFDTHLRPTASFGAVTGAIAHRRPVLPRRG